MKDSDVKKFAQNKIKELKQEIAKWEKVLSAFGEGSNKSTTENITQPKQHDVIESKKKYMPSEKITLQQKVIAVLKHFNRPVLSDELMEKMNELYPDKIYVMKSFSGTFSGMYTKPDSGIKQYAVKKATLKIRALYGLDEWFEDDGKDLKPEYQKKVMEKFSTL